MNDITVKKEKVIKEFRNELKEKVIVDRKKYDIPFFKILNELYVFHPREMKCHISRFNSLTFSIIIHRTYIYIEWSEKFTLLSITDDEFENDGIYNTTLDEALEIVKKIWRKI